MTHLPLWPVPRRWRETNRPPHPAVIVATVSMTSLRGYFPALRQALSRDGL